MAANTTLREAILLAGLTPAKLAERVQVDPKTVERWVVQGRRPHPVTRYAVAAQLGKSVADLWPDETASARPSRLSFAGICIWCERSACESSDCVVRHESSQWETCPACAGTPWTRPGGCGCLFGVVQSAKFATLRSHAA
ncbi:helix-turn-helix transcriptional regulator [Nocardia abscessus]|uniref:helix-turn-helix transcriptional regulator n=1 Tax=Nocardia abscessus TaxID=120957 RepID=UPI00189349F8|nr:helix-turn-helix transcriptional regulator [Nocardia abscessus]MBF6471658.1 helix-turn-helix transcriptional regulator [Nocardia abscessus]